MTVVAVRLLCAFVAMVVIGNVGIMAASWLARATTRTPATAPVAGVDNLQAVDHRVWRGAAPSGTGYRRLAGEGVTTVVDLRAEAAIDSSTPST